MVQICKWFRLVVILRTVIGLMVQTCKWFRLVVILRTVILRTYDSWFILVSVSVF